MNAMKAATIINCTLIICATILICVFKTWVPALLLFFMYEVKKEQ